jgi:hypothetical protein
MAYGLRIGAGTPTNIGEVSVVLRCEWFDYRRSADTLVTYLLCHVAGRARIIAELTKGNPGMAELLVELDVESEADDDLRAQLEMEAG